MRIKKRWVVTGVAIATATCGGWVAYAAWSASGTGTGADTALTAQSITISATTPTAELFPGKAGGTLYLALNNPNPYPVDMTGVTYGSVTSGDPAHCLSSYVTIDGSAPLSVNFALAGHASNVSETISGVIDMSKGAPDGCQGVSFTIGVTLTGTSGPAQVDWPEFHNSNDRAGYNQYETALSPGNASQLLRRWSYATAGRVDSSPAVVNGVVYVGSNDGNVYAFNASSGALIWSHLTGGAIAYSSPAVSNGVVYVGSSDRSLYALSAGTGSVLWSYPTGGPVYSSPAVNNGIVYVGSNDGRVYALNASNGTLVWSAVAGGSILNSSPVVANGDVFIGSYDGNLSAFNATTGGLVWRYTLTGSIVGSSPTFSNGMVYFGGFDGTYALNATTGTLVWHYQSGQATDSTPAVANGVVYIGSGGQSSLYAFNATNGTLLWTFNNAVDEDSSPAVANGVVYFGAWNQNVYAVNASTGALLWTYGTGDHIDYSSPAVANGRVYIGSWDGQLYAFGLLGGGPSRSPH